MKETLGKRIMGHRKRLGLTQDQLAEKLGVSAQAVSKWENDLSCPDIGLLPALAEIFGITVDALLGRETEEAHVGEVVEEEKEEERFHWKNDSTGMEFSFGNGRRGILGLAAWVLLTGILLLAAQIWKLEVGLWDILWPTGVLMFGLFGLWPKFSFFRLGCALFGGYFLWEQLGPFPLDRAYLLPALLLLLGLSLLVDALRKPAKPKLHFSYGQAPGVPTGTTGYCPGDKGFTFTGSFQDLDQTIDLDTLKWGEIKTSFGDVDLDFTKVKSVTEDCTVKAECAFGDLTLLIPRRYQVASVNKASFGAIQVEGEPDPTPQGVVHLLAKVSFGQITVKYI